MVGVFRDKYLGSVASGCGVRGANPHRQRPLRMPSDLQFGKRVILIDAMKKTTERFDGSDRAHAPSSSFSPSRCWTNASYVTHRTTTSYRDMLNCAEILGVGPWGWTDWTRLIDRIVGSSKDEDHGTTPFP